MSDLPHADEGLRIAAEEQARLRRGMAIKRATVLAAQVLLIVALLVGWEFAPETGLLDPFYISRPHLVFGALQTWTANGTLWLNVLVTLRTALAGFAIGAGLGFLLGVVLGTSFWLGKIITPILSAIQSIPRLALVPLFILWFGVGATSKIALVATVVFFLVFNATVAGVRAVDEHLTNAPRIMRAKTWHVHTMATLPSAVVWISEGLRISVPWAVVATATAEIMSSNEGMGYLITRSASQFYTAGVFASLIVLTLLGVALTGLVVVLEKYLLAWRTEGAR